MVAKVPKIIYGTAWYDDISSIPMLKSLTLIKEGGGHHRACRLCGSPRLQGYRHG